MIKHPKLEPEGKLRRQFQARQWGRSQPQVQISRVGNAEPGDITPSASWIRSAFAEHNTHVES